jgi:hypothetical protein
MKTVSPVPTLPVPTGNAWIVDHTDPATIPVALPIIIRRVEGPYTERDRKLWTWLLHAVWDDLDETIVHEMSVSRINKFFRELGGQHDSQWIWESATRLAKTTIEWTHTLGDSRYEQGIEALFGAVLSHEARKSGILRFHFPPLLIPILKDPRRYARLRTHVMIGLSGKYAVTLYEMLESVANMRTPILRAKLDDLRQWLKVPDGSYKLWGDFRRYVLEPAIKQFNDKPDEGAGFSVKMQPIKEGRAVREVHFTVAKTKKRQALEAKIKDTQQLSLFEVRLKTPTYETARKFAPGWDIYALEAEWREWGQQRKEWPPTNPDGAFIAFCKRRGMAPGR